MIFPFWTFECAIGPWVSIDRRSSIYSRLTRKLICSICWHFFARPLAPPGLRRCYTSCSAIIWKSPLAVARGGTGAIPRASRKQSSSRTHGREKGKIRQDRTRGLVRGVGLRSARFVFSHSAHRPRVKASF